MMLSPLKIFATERSRKFLELKALARIEVAELQRRTERQTTIGDLRSSPGT
jgi:hypothetical protein